MRLKKSLRNNNLVGLIPRAEQEYLSPQTCVIVQKLCIL